MPTGVATAVAAPIAALSPEEIVDDDLAVLAK
jgi:hypothetical protein